MNFKYLIDKIEDDLDAGMWESAHESWNQLPPETQQAINGQLLHCQWLIGMGKKREAVNFIKLIDPKRCTGKEQKKLKNLGELLQIRELAPTPPRKIPEKLDRTLHQLRIHLSAEKTDEDEALSLLKSIVQNKEFNHVVAHDLLQILKACAGAWPFLILHLFPISTKINPKPLITWKTWLRDCPTSHRNSLLVAMEQHLELRPNYRMESWLKKKVLRKFTTRTWAKDGPDVY